MLLFAIPDQKVCLSWSKVDRAHYISSADSTLKEATQPLDEAIISRISLTMHVRCVCIAVHHSKRQKSNRCRHGQAWHRRPMLTMLK